MKRDAVIERDYPSPPERVWVALTDSQALGAWLMENDFQPRLGHRFQFKTKPRGSWDGIVHCEVTELEEPHRLAYKWEGGNLRTTVTWTLTPTSSGTRLRLEHKGFAGIRGLLLSFLLGSGWKRMLREKVPVVLAHINEAGFAASPGLPANDCH